MDGYADLGRRSGELDDHGGVHEQREGEKNRAQYPFVDGHAARSHSSPSALLTAGSKADAVVSKSWRNNRFGRGIFARISAPQAPSADD